MAKKKCGIFGEAFEAMLEKELRRSVVKPTGAPMPRVKSKAEVEWDRMTDDEKCLAYGRSVLNNARRRDKKFPRERNEANARYDMYVTWAYGGDQ